MSQFRSLLKLIRPKQWMKNAFLFGPLVFSRELFDLGPLLTSLVAFAGFCLTASSVYVINDIVDREADRAHPEKRNRPLASGAVSVRAALILLAILLAGALSLAMQIDYRYGIILALYFGMNILYSLKLKEIVLLDVFIIAAGFMLRVLAGAYAIAVEVSSWIVLCTMFISLFLGFAKRRGEIVLSQQAGRASERKVLNLYRVDVIDQLLTISAAGTVIAYALYTVSTRTVEVFGTDRLIYSTVFVLYGIFRYLYLIYTTDETENPTNALSSDPAILINGILWITACVFIIYFKGEVPGLSR